MAVLSSMSPGQRGRVKTIVKGSKLERRLFDIGLAPGVEFTMITRHPFRGPIILQIGNSKIALGRGIADSVEVELKN
ncbi:MAG: FeoA family protein [Syntrophomonadaceae bacterium]|jgi:ferrous iron transport protein A